LRQVIASAGALLLGFALLHMGNALQSTLLALRGQSEGFSALAIGAVMSGFFMGMGAGSFLVPAIIRRAGHLRAFAAFASLASAAALAHLLFVEVAAWLVIRAFSGVCFAGLLMVVESWLNASIASRQRGSLLAIYAMTALGAGALGQMQISLAAPASHVLFALVAILLSLGLVPAVLSRAANPLGDFPDSRVNIALVLRAAPFGAIATLFVGMSIGCFFALGPVFAESRGLTNAQLGAFMGLCSAGAMITQWPLGRLSDRVSRRGVATGTTCGAMAVLAAFLLLPDSTPGVTLLLSALLGATMLPIQAIAVAQVNDRVERADMVAAAGTLVLVMAVGAASGPMLGGLAIDMLGPSGLLWSLLAFQVATAAIGATRLALRPARAGSADRVTLPVIMEPVAGPLSLNVRKP